MLRFNPIAENSLKSSNLNEIGVAPIQSTSTVISTKNSNYTSPPKDTNGKNPLQMAKKSKSIKSVSSHWTDRIDSTSQSRLPQFFKSCKPRSKIPEKSVFDAKHRVEPIKNIIHSPDLFSTPTQTISVPEEIYDFGYLPDSTSSNLNGRFNIQEIDKENEPPKKVSPPLIYTPIQRKINEERKAENTTNGFVDAKAICKKDLTNHQRQNPSDLEKEKQSTSTNSQLLEMDEDVFSEFDEDFLDMIYDELNELASQKKLEINGLNRSTAFKSSKQKLEQTFLQDLKLNFNNHNKETIRKDFEDGSESSDDLDMWQGTHNVNHTNTENQKSFFSIIADNELDESTENHNKPMNDKVKRVDVQKPSTSIDKMLPLPAPSKNVDLIRTAPTQRETMPTVWSQASSLSTKAVCGSQVRHEPSPMVRNRPIGLKRPSLNCFDFVPPRQIQTSNDRLAENQSAQLFLAPDSSPEQKRARIDKIDINKLLEKNLAGKEYQMNVRR